MATKVQITYCGMEGSGKSLAAAKQDAALKLERLVSDLGRGPRILSLGRFAALIFRDALGWQQKLIADAEGVKTGIVSGSGAYQSEDDALRGAVIHLAQCAWSFEENDTIFAERAATLAPFSLRRAIVDEILSWTKFQRAYKQARDAGHSDAEAHHIALQARR